MWLTGSNRAMKDRLDVNQAVKLAYRLNVHGTHIGQRLNVYETVNRTAIPQGALS